MMHPHNTDNCDCQNKLCRAYGIADHKTAGKYHCKKWIFDKFIHFKYGKHSENATVSIIT